MKYSTDKFIASHKPSFKTVLQWKTWKTAERALTENGWKIDFVNIYNFGECGEFTFKHSAYDQPIEVETTDEISTEDFIRSLYSKNEAEMLIEKSKQIRVEAGAQQIAAE